MIHERKNYKVEFIKIKNFCSAIDNVKKMRRQALEWAKIFPKDISIKDGFPKYTKNS